MTRLEDRPIRTLIVEPDYCRNAQVRVNIAHLMVALTVIEGSDAEAGCGHALNFLSAYEARVLGEFLVESADRIEYLRRGKEVSLRELDEEFPPATTGTARQEKPEAKTAFKPGDWVLMHHATTYSYRKSGCEPHQCSNCWIRLTSAGPRGLVGLMPMRGSKPQTRRIMLDDDNEMRAAAPEDMPAIDSLTDQTEKWPGKIWWMRRLARKGKGKS